MNDKRIKATLNQEYKTGRHTFQKGSFVEIIFEDAKFYWVLTLAAITIPVPKDFVSLQ